MSESPQITAVTPIGTVFVDAEDMKWSPQPGPELAALLDHKLANKPEAQLQVTAATRAILGRGVPPGEQKSDTGLIIGYVQSGKTLSFTSVMALARDNGFQLIVVIAGSSTQLSDQSYRRIRDDLRANVDGRRVWALYPNPKLADAQGIIGLLDQWQDPHAPLQQRQTVVLTVMKQTTHLRNLNKLLKKLDLSSVSALIIDDEADQASMNTQAQANAAQQLARESTTYRRLMELRGLLPSHTYLQYTATPQAPLLISIIDSLSASWVEVLQPGNGYTGGITFFGAPPDRRPNSPPPERSAVQAAIVRIIPATEIPSANNQLASAPATLQTALMLFMIGVAAAFAKGESSGNRSMLVHPSVRTADHELYFHWINDLFHLWRATFSQGTGNAAAQALLVDFRVAYDDLAASVGSEMPDFERVSNCLRTAFNNTELKEVNRRQNGPPVIIDWNQRYSWILVGGQSMDRGFTIEGLTITYMPRGLGGGNADTMQQRARFFGYKANYLGYCRVFLERDAKQGFEDYVEHEEFMRNDMIAIRDNRQPLNTWPRRFVLDSALKLCRDNVLRDGYSRARASTDNWFTPQAFMGAPDRGEFNQSHISNFIASNNFLPDTGNADRTETQKHLITAPLALHDVVEKLLADYRVRDPGEVEKWTTLLAILGNLLEEDRAAQAIVYQMSAGRARTRGLYPTGRVKQLFQGEYPVLPLALRGSVYPGDKAIFTEGLVTVQIHNLSLTDESGNSVAANIPFLAIRLPEQARPIAIQFQPDQPTFDTEVSD